MLWQGQRRRRLKCEIIAAADLNGNKLIDGKSIAAEIRLEVAKAVEDLPSPPGLAVILVGDRPDSRAYVRMKKKACEKAGILDLGIDLDHDPDPSLDLDIDTSLDVDLDLSLDVFCNGVT